MSHLDPYAHVGNGLTQIAVLDDYQHVALKFTDWSAILPRASVDLFDTTIQISDIDKLVNRLEKYEIIVTMRERTKFPRQLLERLPKLKLLTTTAPKNASIDVQAASDHGKTVVGTGYHGKGTAEHAWALLLATVRGLAHEHVNTVNGAPSWQSVVPTSLREKKLGIVGLGNLGKLTANFGKAFGMEVQAWSPNLTQERCDAEGVKFIPTKEELFKTSDVISIHIVLSLSSVGLIDYSTLSLMKPTAFLINTSRGPLIKEADLIRAIKEGIFAGVGLDVFDTEPLPLDHELRALAKDRRVTLTPHVGYVDENLYSIFWGDTVDNINAYLDGNRGALKVIRN
ncbi:D-isomer specific 2-hydroxyacid dehydrogenase [Cantharellus anzutake]|uniref:D-isomer specific 2-hydroxyacid dehydrogenase n=1 Tax=Cantharellus anzutake TaxID=1750568 RepID=UPI0019076DF8|nr:D-isomer specific 2-hydroxyacid dehydrogenase [Cantharellus anzutake]KAF8330144.1 D-isomer specific 2-hydroxyacid dehydrogenase [Cantharellus anzutake]